MKLEKEIIKLLKEIKTFLLAGLQINKQIYLELKQLNKEEKI